MQILFSTRKPSFYADYQCNIFIVFGKYIHRDLKVKHFPRLTMGIVSVIILSVCIIGVSRANPPASSEILSRSLVQRAADLILKHQASDGAITMGEIRPSPAVNDISPYCANLAGIGLVSAYRYLHEGRYLHAAEKWVRWYEKHIGTDGIIEDYKGQPSSWQSTGHYDSTDSYASTWLDLVQKIYQAGAGRIWLQARWDSVKKIAGAMELTRQSDGMTCATPKWPVMYAMDNIETSRGIKAAIRIGTELGHKDFATKERTWRDQLNSSFENILWNPKIKRYAVGVQSDGAIVPFKGEWYPSGMADIMAVAWKPLNARRRALYASMRKTYGLPLKCETGDDMKQIAFWLMAARRVGAVGDTDKLMNVLRNASDTVWESQYPDVLGFICRGSIP